MSDLTLVLNEGRDRVSDPMTQYPLARELNKELHTIDPYLHVVFVSERAPKGVIPGLEPGRWHLRRQPPGQIDSYWPIMGPNGEFRELGMDLIERMRANDLWKPGAIEELNKRKYRRAERKARAAALYAEQAQDMLKMDMRAANRVFGEGGMLARKQFRG